MDRSDVTLCLITDEVSSSLDVSLAFAQNEGFTTIDLRVFDGKNVLAHDHASLRDAARRISAAGLAVSCICSPLLKWSLPGSTASNKGDQFGFDLGDRLPSLLYRQAFEAAELLGARHLRIFSYLVYDNWTIEHLDQPLNELIALADHFDMKVHIENENVCNVDDFAGLEAVVTAWRHPRLRALPDIANAWRAGKEPSGADLARLLPFTDILHVKDYSTNSDQFVGLGEGDVPLATILTTALDGHSTPLTFTLETHAPSDPVGTTRRSIATLREIVSQL